MDLVGYGQATFDTIVAEYAAFAQSIGIESFTAMPISGFKGDNITAPSENTLWYRGPTLIEHLESVEILSSLDADKPFRMPVQWVNRPNLDFRGFSGMIATGAVKAGDAVRVLPSGKTSKVTRVVTMDGDVDEAVAGESVTICFADEIRRPNRQRDPTGRHSGLITGKALGKAGDEVVNAFLVRAVSEQRPEDGLLSEEGRDTLDRLSKSRVWIIDPVDGTREYGEARPDWAIHVGLAIDGKARLGGYRASGTGPDTIK